MPLPAIAAPLLGAAGSAISSLITNKGGKKSQARANKYNVDFWNMQNDYNNPTAQMARLREAGLNPNLIYGAQPSSATGNAESIAPSKAAPFNFESPVNDIGKFAQLGKTTATTDNLREQNQVLAQEAILKAAQTAKLGTDNARGKFDLGLAQELKDTSLQAAKANLANMEQSTIQKELDNTVKSGAQKSIMKDLFYRAENAKETLQGTKLLNNLRQLEVELKRIGIERNDPWYFRIIGRHLDEIDAIVKKSKKVEP